LWQHYGMGYVIYAYQLCNNNIGLILQNMLYLAGGWGWCRV